MAGTVGNIKVNFTGDASSVAGAANQAAASIETFSGTVNRNQGHFIKFNTHMLESRKAIGLFANILGTSAGPLMHIVHTFGLLGSAAGGAVASLLLMREGYQQTTVEIKAASKEQLKFYDGLKNINTLHEFGEQFTKIKDELREMQNPGFLDMAKSLIPGGTDAYLDKIRNKLTEQKHLHEEYKRFLKGGAGEMQHVQSAVKTQELGAFKNEHSGQNPQIQALDKNTEALKDVYKVIQLTPEMYRKMFNEAVHPPGTTY